MNFKKYEDIKVFWKDTRNLLEKEEWYNTLLIGNCNEAIEKGNIDMFFATVTNNDKIVQMSYYTLLLKVLLGR